MSDNKRKRNDNHGQIRVGKRPDHNSKSNFAENSSKTPRFQGLIAELPILQYEILRIIDNSKRLLYLIQKLNMVT